MRPQLLLGSLIFAIATIGISQNADAQAVTPASKDLEIGTSYTLLYSTESAGVATDLIANILTLTADLGLPGQFALSASVPLILLQSETIGAHGPDDDGNFHGSLHDFRTDIRRSFWLSDNLAIAPQLGISIPMQDYTTQGNSAVGRGIIEGHLGLSVMWIEPFLDRTFIAGNYTFSEGQRSDEGGEQGEDYAQRHSNYAVQFGYFVNENLEVHGIVFGQQYHDGFDFELDFRDAPMILQDNHDTVVDDDFLHIGAGLGYSVSDKLSVGGSVTRHIIGNDNGNVATYLNLYLGYNFSFGSDSIDKNWDEEDWGDEEEWNDAQTENPVGEES